MVGGWYEIKVNGMKYKDIFLETNLVKIQGATVTFYRMENTFLGRGGISILSQANVFFLFVAYIYILSFLEMSNMFG